MECPVILESPDVIHLQKKNISSNVKSENLYHRKACFRFMPCQNKMNFEREGLSRQYLVLMMRKKLTGCIIKPCMLNNNIILSLIR